MEEFAKVSPPRRGDRLAKYIHALHSRPVHYSGVQFSPPKLLSKEMENEEKENGAEDDRHEEEEDDEEEKQNATLFDKVEENINVKTQNDTNVMETQSKKDNELKHEDRNDENIKKDIENADANVKLTQDDMEEEKKANSTSEDDNIEDSEIKMDCVEENDKASQNITAKPSKRAMLDDAALAVWLGSLGMAQYLPRFRQEGITTRAALFSLSVEDLQRLSIDTVHHSVLLNIERKAKVFEMFDSYVMRSVVKAEHVIEETKKKTKACK